MNVSIPENRDISAFEVFSGSVIDRVVLFCGPDATDSIAIGGDGGTSSGRIEIPKGRHLRSIFGRHGEYVDSLTFVDDSGNVLGRFGGGGGDLDFIFEIPSCVRLVGFRGRAGDVVNAFGLNYAPFRAS